MSTTGLVLVSLNLFCLLPCLILMAGALRTGSPLSRLFAWLAALNMLGLLMEASIAPKPAPIALGAGLPCTCIRRVFAISGNIHANGQFLNPYSQHASRRDPA